MKPDCFPSSLPSCSLCLRGEFFVLLASIRVHSRSPIPSPRCAHPRLREQTPGYTPIRVKRRRTRSLRLVRVGSPGSPRSVSTRDSIHNGPAPLRYQTTCFQPRPELSPSQGLASVFLLYLPVSGNGSFHPPVSWTQYEATPIWTT